MTKDERLAIVDRDFACRAWDEVGGQIEAGIIDEAISELEQWHTPDETPTIDYTNDEAKRWIWEASEDVEVLVRLTMNKGIRRLRDGSGEEIEWRSPQLFGLSLRGSERVVGWKALETKEEPYSEEWGDTEQEQP